MLILARSHRCCYSNSITALICLLSAEVALSTVVDSLDEAREELSQQQSPYQDAHEEGGVSSKPKRSIMRIVSGGVGSVTMKDVTTAIAANGNVVSLLIDLLTFSVARFKFEPCCFLTRCAVLIAILVTYNVDFETDASRLAQVICRLLCS